MAHLTDKPTLWEANIGIQRAHVILQLAVFIDWATRDIAGIISSSGHHVAQRGHVIGESYCLSFQGAAL